VKRRLIGILLCLIFGAITFAAWIAVTARRSDRVQIQSFLPNEVERLRDPQPYEAFEWIDRVAYSNDGTNVAASYSKIIEVWKTQAPCGEPVCKLIGHGDRVWGIAFSPDDKYIATASEDQTVRLWNKITGKEIRQFERVDRAPRDVCFSPDGTLLAATVFRKILIWNVETGKTVKEFDDWGEGAGAYESVVFLSDGATIWASAELSDFAIQAWNVASGERVKVPVTPSARESGMLARSENGRWLVIGEQQTISCWDTTSGECLWSYRAHEAMNHYDVAISRDGSKAIHQSQFLQMWDVPTGKELWRFNIPRSIMTSAAFSPDGNFVVTGDDEGSVRIWRVPKQE